MVAWLLKPVAYVTGLLFRMWNGGDQPGPTKPARGDRRTERQRRKKLVRDAMSAKAPKRKAA